MHERDSLPMHRVERIHLIGVGGAGMSGIAEVLCNLGYQVSGSDIHATSTTAHLHDIGVRVLDGHAAGNVAGADVVVHSSAIDEHNVELQAARKQRIPIVPRAAMLAELMRFRRGIAVAGTHGKTTTTSLIASILAEGGLDPTFVVGGLVRSVNAHARLGTGQYLVAEADESDRSFLLLNPLITVLTNVDADHMATYDDDFASLKATFVEFLRRLPFYGVACVCIDDVHAASLIPQIPARVITYGARADADVRGSGLRHVDGREHFQVAVGSSDPVDFELNLSGEHNVINALAAVAVASELGVETQAMQNALRTFQGIGRRCQVFYNVAIARTLATVVDDYAHHPREIDVVLQTVRRRWPLRRLVVVFQPHRHSRTRDLFEDFVSVLSHTDILIMLEVYSAGEDPIPGADARALCRALRRRGQVDPIFVADLGDVTGILRDVVETDDVVVILGAGNISEVAESLVPVCGQTE